MVLFCALKLVYDPAKLSHTYSSCLLGNVILRHDNKKASNLKRHNYR